MVTATLAISTNAHAAVETTIAHGLSHATSSAFGRPGESSVRNGGYAFALHVALRLRHPVMPFLEIGGSPVYASDDAVDLGRYGGPTIARSRSSVWWVLAGPEVPLGPVRLWAGIGAFDLAIRSTVLGVTMHSGDLSMGYGAGATLYVVERRWFRAGLSGRVLLMSEIETALYHGGLVLGAAF